MALSLGRLHDDSRQARSGAGVLPATGLGGPYALLSSADQVPRPVGEGFGQVSAQFRELELEELGQTPPRLVEHVVARFSDSGAVTGEFRSKAVRALRAQASVPSEVPEPEDVGPDDPASAAVPAFIAQHTRAPHRADLTYRRDPDGVSDSMHWMRAAARRLRSGLRVFRSLLDRAWADELKCAGSGPGEARELEVLIARLEKRIAALPADAVPDDPSVSAMGRIREQQAQARGRVAVLLASDRYLELHERLSAAAATPPTTEAADQQASQALPPLFHKAWPRPAKRAEVVLEDESGLPGGRRTPTGTRCVSPPSGPGMPARRSRACSARRPRPSPA
jgi:inorganic triphosphatase YgiF